MELLKDYDCSIIYHRDKANVVADVLSRTGMCFDVARASDCLCFTSAKEARAELPYS